LNFHSREQRSNAKIDLTSSQAAPSSAEQPKAIAKVHGILIIAWVLWHKLI